MKRRLAAIVILGTVAGVYAVFSLAGWPQASQGSVVRVVRGPLAVWVVYEGRMEARRLTMIMSRFRGNATVIDLAPDGARAAKGDVLVRFDSTALERDVLKLERDAALARSELQGLVNAKIPLEVREIEMKLLEARTTLDAEKQYLEDMADLMKEGLVAEPEIKQQRSKVDQVSRQVETLELQIKLTKSYGHPSAVERARATLASAEQELRIAREQLANSVVTAPADGVVVHKPLHVGGEFRTVRVGDGVFPNQPFMILPDLTDMVVHLSVPEAELPRVQNARDVLIQPLAYPDANLSATVESVGSAAQNLAERPVWQKFFHVVIGLKAGDPRLRPGMSVTARLLSYHNPDALLIPRGAVRWEEGKPVVKTTTTFSQALRPVKPGHADDKNYEVLEGLNPGDRVVIE